MACYSCKSKKVKPQIKNDQSKEKTEKSNRLLGLLFFVISLVLLPIIIVGIIGFLFNHFVLQYKIDTSKLIKGLKRKKKPILNDDLGNVNLDKLQIVEVENIK